MVGNMEVPQTLKLTLNLTPTQGIREPSGKGDAECRLGKVRVGRAQIDAQTPILDENTFWTSWVLLTCPKTQWLALGGHSSKTK